MEAAIHKELTQAFYAAANITKRPGIEKLLAYLSGQTDFFRAPASTKYHGSYEGGLLEHSLNVYDQLSKEVLNNSIADNTPVDTVIITALFHDICKANFYKESTRNVKKDGVWVQVPYYEVEDQLPFGHGEKSVILLQAFIKLSTEEIAAIRWHMGSFDNAVKGGDYSLSTVYEKYPLALLLHIADMKASYFIEKKVNE